MGDHVGVGHAAAELELGRGPVTGGQPFAATTRRRARSAGGTTRRVRRAGHAVHHAVAGEPVVAGGIRRDRIRADPQQASLEIARDPAGDAQRRGVDSPETGAKFPER